LNSLFIRDIKLDNIFVVPASRACGGGGGCSSKGGFVVKIIDFGIGELMRPGHRLSLQCGTLQAFRLALAYKTNASFCCSSFFVKRFCDAPAGTPAYAAPEIVQDKKCVASSPHSLFVTTCQGTPALLSTPGH
jgi:serine/threonine protein kinase